MQLIDIDILEIAEFIAILEFDASITDGSRTLHELHGCVIHEEAFVLVAARFRLIELVLDAAEMLRALLKLVLRDDWREPSSEHFILVMNFRLHLVLNARIFKAIRGLTLDFAPMLSKLGDRASLEVLLSARLVQPTLNNLGNLIFAKKIIFLNAMKVVVVFAQQDFLGARLGPSLTVWSTLETISVALAPLVFFLSNL